MITAQSYIVDLIEGRRQNSLVKGALLAMSTLFEAGIKLRNLAFDRRWIKEKKVDLPVISIGNIIAGGSGKTAFIQRLGKDLAAFGKVSILSRGYRSQIEKVGGSLHLISQSRITPEVCGDEAYLLNKSLPDALLFVGKDRILGAERAVYHQADLILLDDGMQYRTLHRDIEIVMLHGDDLYGKGFFLPRGYLRDSPSRLKRAHYIVLNHVRSQEHFKALELEIRKWTHAPLLGARMVPKGVETLCGNRMSDLKKKRVAIFCGLGKPDSFISTVKELGAKVVETWILPDHVAPTEEELKKFALSSAQMGCDLLICSEKDGVKLPYSQNLPLPIGILKAEMDIVYGKKFYTILLNQIGAFIPQRRRR